MIELYLGDCIEVMKTLPDNCVDCVVTSPPYWSLRDYGVDGQLGRERTFEEYISNLTDVFIHIKRVLKLTGIVYVNLGDTYVSSGATRHVGYTDAKYPNGRECNSIEPSALAQSIPPKCLAQIPSRFAISMCDAGYILRSEIIWHKPNAMPESAKDRYARDYEKYLCLQNQVNMILIHNMICVKSKEVYGALIQNLINMRIMLHILKN